MVDGRALALVVTVLLAGCSQGGTPDKTEAPEPAFEELGLEATATTGVIRGVVVDDAVRPLPNVTVALTGTDQQVTTKADGLFGFASLEPGAYFLQVSKPGYFPVQQSAEVVAGESEPPIVKVLLVADVNYIPYVAQFVNEGWIECTTSVLVLCGAPNTLEPIFCAGYEEPPLPPFPPICYGNLTNDRFTWNFHYAPNMTWMQMEMVWESSQTLSPELGLEMETLAPGCVEDDYYFFASGPSPIVWGVDGEEIADTDVALSPECPVYYSVFAGGNAGVPAGFTLQQRFTAYGFAFYSYAPPEGWSFAETGTVPQPPV